MTKILGIISVIALILIVSACAGGNSYYSGPVNDPNVLCAGRTGQDYNSCVATALNENQQKMAGQQMAREERRWQSEYYGNMGMGLIGQAAETERAQIYSQGNALSGQHYYQHYRLHRGW